MDEFGRYEVTRNVPTKQHHEKRDINVTIDTSSTSSTNSVLVNSIITLCSCVCRNAGCICDTVCCICSIMSDDDD